MPNLPKFPDAETDYSVLEAATYLKLSRRTIILMIERGELKAYRMTGAPKSRWRIPGSEIAKKLRDRVISG